METWKEIAISDGNYLISNFGNVKREDGRLLKPYLLKRGCGYYRIRLIINGKRRGFLIHRLVAEAFIPNPKNYPVVNHLDENGLNNKDTNLEWCDQKYNVNYGSANKKRSRKLVNNKSMSKSLIVISPDGKETLYPSINEVSRKYGINRGNINLVLAGRRNHAGGFRFKRP